jgi:Escherichia/Staphylococcus phage prohead protease
MQKEIRTITNAGLRAVGGTGADPMALMGYAAKFGKYSQDLGGFFERIAPTAFSRALKEKQDVRALLNHDPNLILGRTKNGTLTLSVDDVGLSFRVELPNTQVARDLHTSVARGDIDQCSFAFKVPTGGDNWGEDKDENGNYFASRELQDVDLFDVSCVVYPAYLDTNVSARTSDFVPAEVRSAVDKRNAEKREASLEQQIASVNAALNQKFGLTQGGWAKYQTLETYGDSAIICAWENGNDASYYRIAYTIDANGAVTLGDMQAVEKTWVPANERGAARLEELRAAHKRLMDPDNDGDDDSDLLESFADAKKAAKAIADAADKASVDLNENFLADFVTKGGEAIAAISDAVSAATAELAEGANSSDPNGEKRTPDPAGTRPHMEGVSMPKPSNKVMLAESDAKLATAHAALKAAKVAHTKAKEEAAAVGDDQNAKADAAAKVAAAHAAVKSAKAVHMKAAEDHEALKHSIFTEGGDGTGAGEDPVDGFDPDIQECMCRHCRTGMMDRDDSQDGPDDDVDCTDPSCDCQNRWSVTGDDGMMRSINPGEERADKVRTKRVGGKDLTKDKFAYVGDPDRTETWKLPIHDESHVRNALARFGQTKGIPADKKSGVWRKIKAAAAKFGIEVSKEQNSLALAGVAPDEQERLLMKARLGAMDTGE